MRWMEGMEAVGKITCKISVISPILGQFRQKESWVPTQVDRESRLDHHVVDAALLIGTLHAYCL